MMFMPAQPSAGFFHQASVAPPDSSAIRRAPVAMLDAFRDNPDFQYAQEKLKGLTWWDEFKRWLFNRLADVFEENEQGQFWKFLFYGVALFVLFWATLHFLKMDVRGVFATRKTGERRLFNASVENIQENDFLTLAEHAIQQGNLRLAARMYYMHVLKALDAKEVIVWSPRKTNQDYLAECKRTSIKPDFARLTYLFDYSWYGDFPVDKPLVDEMRTLAQRVIVKEGGGL